jgi:cation diffusion facilitator family transporter
MHDHLGKQDEAYGTLPLLAARISVYLIAMLAALKLIFGLAIGSIAIVSEGIHTTVDLAASLIALFTLKAAVKPPDIEHPYGHGKIENLMGLIQAGFIIVPSGYIIYRALHHLIFHRSQIFGEHMEGLNTGIIVMVITVVVNLLLGLWLNLIFRRTKSEAIRANAYHQFADLYTSIGVVAALILVKITGNVIFDPIVAIVIAFYAIYLGLQLMIGSAAPLLDIEAPPEVVERIRQIIRESHPDIVDFHNLRTRRAGQMIFGDIHVQFCKDMTLEMAHDMMDEIENTIEKEIGNVDITVHAEPCEDDCDACPHPGGTEWKKRKAATDLITPGS